MVINQTTFRFFVILVVLALVLLANWSAFGHGSKPKPEPKPKPIVTTITHITPVEYNACAANAAISGIPAISHHLNHKSHSAVGLGVGSCEGQSAAALGLQHQDKDTSYKASIGFSGHVKAVSGGISVGF